VRPEPSSPGARRSTATSSTPPCAPRVSSRRRKGRRARAAKLALFSERARPVSSPKRMAAAPLELREAAQYSIRPRWPGSRAAARRGRLMAPRA
jgi:hypothetical protein